MGRLIFFFCTMVVWNACQENQDMPIEAAEISQDVLLEGLNEFQWKLFQATVSRLSADENVQISPLSVA
ncbi:MAG: hypothetical protein OEQ53_22985, partial [Saprospiraceae bacterium]|nr:hypothetical protein [Saprospiraceae bacterium]